MPTTLKVIKEIVDKLYTERTVDGGCGPTQVKVERISLIELWNYVQGVADTYEELKECRVKGVEI